MEGSKTPLLDSWHHQATERGVTPDRLLGRTQADHLGHRSQVDDNRRERSKLSTIRRKVSLYKSVRVRPRHNVKVRIPEPHKEVKANLGPLGEQSNLTKRQVSGLILANLNKIFRHRTEWGFRILTYIQTALIGTIHKVSSLSLSMAPHVRMTQGYVLIYRKPTFKAIRHFLASYNKDCTESTFDMNEVLRVIDPAQLIKSNSICVGISPRDENSRPPRRSALG